MDLDTAVLDVRAAVLKTAQRQLEFPANAALVDKHSTTVENLLSQWSKDGSLIEQWAMTRNSIDAVLNPLQQGSKLRILADGRSMAISDFMARLALGNARSMDALRTAVKTGRFEGLNSGPDDTPFSTFKGQFRTNDAYLATLIDQYSAAEKRALKHLEELVLANPAGAELALSKLSQNILPILNNASDDLVRYVDQALAQSEQQFETAFSGAQQDLDQFTELAAVYRVAADLAVKTALSRARLASQIGILSLLTLAILCVYAFWRQRVAAPVHGFVPPPVANEPISETLDQVFPSKTFVHLSDIHNRFKTVSDVMGALSRRIDQHATFGRQSSTDGAEIIDISRQVEKTKEVFDTLLRKNEFELEKGIGRVSGPTKNGSETKGNAETVA